MNIPFNKVYHASEESEAVQQAFQSYALGKPKFSQQCTEIIRSKIGIAHGMLTHSCTTALDMAAYLCDFQEGDEVILPSYTFVSTANAFVKWGAKPIFIDSCSNHPNIDLAKVEQCITKRTKALVVVHYGGFACDMEKAKTLANKYNLFLIEDAAHAFYSAFRDKPLGSFGDFSTFSFHSTKNITSGEGGFLTIRNHRFLEKAHWYADKGTNQQEFRAGNIPFYEWKSAGNACRISELHAAYLYTQLKQAEEIQELRHERWAWYYEALQPLAEQGHFILPQLTSYTNHNASVFYLVLRTPYDALIEFMATQGIHLSFHYKALHQSSFYTKNFDRISLPHAEKFSNQLVRLPLYPSLTEEEVAYVIHQLKAYFK